MGGAVSVMLYHTATEDWKSQLKNSYSLIAAELNYKELEPLVKIIFKVIILLV